MESSELTFDDVRKTFAKIERIIEQNKKNRLLIESAQKLPKDENGYIIMTKEQVEHYYPNAMPVEDFFNQLKTNGKNK